MLSVARIWRLKAPEGEVVWNERTLPLRLIHAYCPVTKLKLMLGKLEPAGLTVKQAASVNELVTPFTALKLHRGWSTETVADARDKVISQSRYGIIVQ